MSETSNKSLFLILFPLGLLGVFSTLLMPINLPEGVNLEISETTLKILSIIQPSILLALAVFSGNMLGRKVGFSAPIIDSIISGRFLIKNLSQLKTAAVMGFLGGVVMTLLAYAFQPLLPQSFVEAGNNMTAALNPVVRFMYGGITEEILMRWGFMSLVVWAIHKISGSKSAPVFISGIIISALLFGAGHLPLAYTLTTEVTGLLITYIIMMNSLLGLIYGWLFWKKGLEASITAHIFTHVAFISITPLLLN